MTAMTASRVRWADGRAPWNGEFEGAESGSQVSIIFNSLEGPGCGPALHRHPYAETFIVRKGIVVFSDGVSSFEASAGEIVVVPAGMPHRFAARSRHVEMIDIHANREFITEWLPQPAAPRLPRG